MPYVTLTPMTYPIAEMLAQEMPAIRKAIKEVVAQLYGTISEHVEVNLMQAPLDSDDDGPGILVEVRTLADPDRWEKAQELSDEISKILHELIPSVIVDIWPWWTVGVWTRYRPAV